MSHPTVTEDDLKLLDPEVVEAAARRDTSPHRAKKRPPPPEIIEDEEELEDPDLPLGATETLGAYGSTPEIKRNSGESIFAKIDGISYEWRMATCEGNIKAQFEQWVRRNALQSISEDSEGNNAVMREMLEVYQSSRAAGEYNWRPEDSIMVAGSAIRKAVSSHRGGIYLAYLLLSRCKQPNKFKGDITVELAEQIFKASPEMTSNAIKIALGNFSGQAAN